MFAKFCRLPLLVALSVTGLELVSAQEVSVSSEPVGFMRVKISGKAAGSGANFLGIPFIREAVYTGTLNTGKPSAFVLIDGDAEWSPEEFRTSESTGASHYVEIKNSTNPEAVGLVSDIVNHTGNALTTADDLSSYLEGGEQFCVRPHHTLASLFGASNEAGLEQGTNETADTISILRAGENASFSTYYYRNAVLGGEGVAIGEQSL